MRLVYVYLGTRGACNDALDLAIGTSFYADVLCVISNKSENYKRWVKEASSNEHFHIYAVPTANNVVKGILGLMLFHRFVKIRRAINNFAPDAVYSYMGHPWERLILPYINCKNLMKTVHDVHLHEGERTLKNKILGRFFSFQCRWTAVYSNMSKKVLVERGVDEENILALPLGCCTLYLDDNYSLQLETKRRFLFFGRLIKYKGIGVLMNSLDSVFKKHPDSKLIVAGRGNVDEYTEIINKYPSNIEIHSEWIPDAEVKNFYKQVDFVVTPYIDATQSGVIPLSYSFGKPVVSSNSGALKEQVKNFETGILCKTGDSIQLADAINYLLENENILKKMKKMAYDYSQELTWKSSACKLIEFLKENI